MYVDDIEIFGKNEKKRTKKPYKNDKNIEPGYSNGTWDWNMSPAHNGKGKRKITKGIKLLKLETSKDLQKKKIKCTWGYWKRTQLNRGERKSNKSEPQKNKATSRNQVLLHKYHQRNKLLDKLPCKLSEAFLKWTMAQKNEPKDKKIDGDSWGHTPRGLQKGNQQN